MVLSLMPGLSWLHMHLVLEPPEAGVDILNGNPVRLCKATLRASVGSQGAVSNPRQWKTEVEKLKSKPGAHDASSLKWAKCMDKCLAMVSLITPDRRSQVI